VGFLDRISFQPPAASPPEAIDITSRGEIQIAWPGGRNVLIPPAVLRDQCPCAACIEEGTGRKLLDPATIPADIHPLRIAAVGNYAVQIFWSDGHSTGIFSWDTLRGVSGIR
jgi:DUF971 family protein